MEENITIRKKGFTRDPVNRYIKPVRWLSLLKLTILIWSAIAMFSNICVVSLVLFNFRLCRGYFHRTELGAR